MLRWALLGVLGASLCGCPGRPPPAPPPEPSASARVLRVESSPDGAEVLVGGTRRCATPCTLRLDAGRYRVTVRKTGYLPYETSVVLPLGEDATVSASLMPSH